MNVADDYKIVRLTEHNMSDLIPLYKDAFGQDKTVEQIAAKFDTAVFGATMLAHIAYSSKGEAAAFYALFPATYAIEGKEVIAAQVGDLMTHSAHRRKGLYIHLAEITHKVAYSEGVEMIFTIPHYQTEGSYSGFVNRLNFVHTHSWNGYYLKVNTAPLAYFSSKSKFTRRLYQTYANWVLGMFDKGYASFQHKVSVSYGEIVKSQDFFSYKQGYTKTYFVTAGNTSIWVKQSGNVLQIGDIQRNGNEDLKRILSKVKLIAFILGLRVIQFEVSPGTYWDEFFVKDNKPFNYFYICIQNPKGFNTNELNFTFADIDSF